MQAERRAGDVDDRVDLPDLVERDLVERDAMDACLRFAEATVDRARSRLDGGWEAGSLQDLEHVGEPAVRVMMAVFANGRGLPMMAIVVLAGDVDVEVQRGEAALLDTWNTIGLRGTASDSYELTDLFVPEAFSSTREDPTLRRERGRLYAFPQQTLYSAGIASVALGIARGMLDAFVELAAEKTPRGVGRLADNAVIQAEVARAEAKLGAARAYLFTTLAEIHERADEVAPIAVPERARVRLAGAHAIHSAIPVADYTYKAAGVDAIFPGSPFERRFRDIHTLSQQIQSRDAHFETVGQVLLGTPPAVFL